VKVREIMSCPVFAVTPDSSIKEAAQVLVEHGISALPVLDANGALVGIVSEADLVPIPGADQRPTAVAEVMTRQVLSVRAQSEVSQAARTMLDAGIKRAPVMSGRKVVGIVSRRDLVRVIARQHDAVQLESPATSP
jgi:CBS domain-containing protein